MSNRYSIITRTVPERFQPRGKFRITRGSDCINCGKCIQLCVYGVHRRQEEDVRRMAEPEFDKCLNCFACVQGCTAGVLSMDLNPAFTGMGDALLTPEQISSLQTRYGIYTFLLWLAIGAGMGYAFFRVTRE